MVERNGDNSLCSSADLRPLRRIGLRPSGNHFIVGRAHCAGEVKGDPVGASSGSVWMTGSVRF